MKKMKFNAKAAVAVAVAMASFIGLNSFKNAEKKADDLHWYSRDNAGNYTYIGQSATQPSSPDCQAPVTDTEICMKGLSTNPNAAFVDDSTPAVQTIEREPLDN
ncbi:hypothetical protein [Sphingobacterium sp.]|uniref:hypothetical protein n=1 Tax=Sphingobacterium sp. TaxID=341027 RepID=UPI00289A341C|nr:hypothetical protein [Sphingobacterium sp.]